MIINLDTVQVGQIFKSLRDMLRHFGFTGMEGNSKKADLKVLANFIEWEKIPHSKSVVITKIK
jgi:hypothetical protein